MTRSSLIEAFKTFTPKEIREFSEFVESPYFNKNANVIRLFGIIRKNYPEFEPEKLNKQKIYKKLFPGKAYKDSTMRLLMFYLYESVEKYLSVGGFLKDRFGYNEKLAREFIDRNLIKEYEKTILKHRSYLDTVRHKEDDYFMNNFIYMEENLKYLSEIFRGKYEKFLTKENLESVTNNLTYYYLLRVFKFYSVSLNTMSLYNIEIDTSIFDNIMGNFNKNSFNEHPVINIYYHIILSFMEPENEVHYRTIKELVVLNDDNISRTTQIDIFINLENYCHRKLRSGNNNYLKESFEVYKIELERDLHLERGFISTPFFTSAVVTGCRLKEFEWVRNFIETYRINLKKESREAIYYYGLSYLENELKNFDKALEYLAKVKAEELYLKMDIRLLQSRIYYALNWSIPLQSLLDTFKKTVQNNRHMKDSRKEHFLKYIKYLNQLNNIRAKEFKGGLKALAAELEQEEYFPYKIWLKEEIEISGG